MVKNYTDVWNNFQFRSPSYLDGHFEPNKFDLVKWYDHKPWEAVDLSTGDKKMVTRSCFVVAALTWHEDACYFDFESCGLRYLQYRVDDLEKFILDFCKSIATRFDIELFDIGDLGW